MRSRIFKSAIVAVLFFALAGISSPVSGSTLSQGLVTTGRAALFNDVLTYAGLVTANASFKQAVNTDPTDMEAHLFYSFTRLVAFGLEQGTTTATLRDMLEDFGIIYNLETATDLGPPYQIPATYPDTSPTADELMAFLTGPFTAEIDAIITQNLDPILAAAGNLASHTDDFLTQLTMAETGELYDTDVDYGDVLSYKAFLQMLKATIQILATYDTANLDIDQLLNAASININDDLLNAYQELLTLLPDSSTTIAAAETTLLAGITTFNEAIDFINAETDDQSNDFIEFENGDNEDLDEVQFLLSKAEESLTSGQPVDLGYIEEAWRIVDGQGSVADMWFDRLLDNTFDGGDYWSMDGDQFLAGGGRVDDFSVDGSTATITLSNNWNWDCLFSATLSGTMSGDNTSITSGTYTYSYTGAACPAPGSGTFTATRTEYYEESLLVDLNELFNPAEPIVARDYLPPVDQDPYTDELFITGMPADRTFSGFLPGGLDFDDDEGIDQVFVWGGHGSSGPFTKFICYVKGLAPWNIQSLTVYGPDTTVDFDLQNGLTHHYEYGTMYGANAGPVQEGWYTFELVDDEGLRFYADKYYTPNLLPKVPRAGNPLIGSWIASDGQPDSTVLLTFLDDSHCILVQDGDSIDDPSGEDGIETATYTYDQETGLFTAVIQTDTNGAWGLSDPPEGSTTTITVDSDTLILTNSVDGIFALTRVAPTANPLVGTWFAGNPSLADNSVSLTFLDDTYFILAEDGNSTEDPSGQDGFELGTYTYNPTTGAFTSNVLLDTSGEWGLSHTPEGSTSTITVGDGLLTYTNSLEGIFKMTQVVRDEVAGRSYLDTTTPTFTWQGVTNDLIDPLYYRLRIMDWQREVIVYDSERSPSTSATVEPGFLEPDTSYKWQVQVFDSATGLASNNFSFNDFRAFSTGAEAEPLAITQAFVRTRLRPEAGVEMTLFGIKIKGPGPWENNTITIKNPDGSTLYTFTNADLHPNGYYIHHEPGILADGTYTFTVVDGRDAITTVTANRTLAANPLADPWPLGIAYEGFLQTATPILTWTPATGAATPLYYVVRIRDYNYNNIYTSAPLADTYSLQLEAGTLMVNSAYLLQVEVYDAASGAKNLTESRVLPFFVEADRPTASISGQISVAAESGYQPGGTIYVGVFDSQHSLDDRAIDGLYSYTALDDATTFTIHNLPVDTQLYVAARWDANDDGSLTPGDWVGSYNANPLVLNTAGATTTGVDLTIDTQFENSSVLVGTVGIVELSHQNYGYDYWLTMSASGVFNNDSTGSLYYLRNDNGFTSSGQIDFDYLVEDNNDGSITSWVSSGSNPAEPTRMVVADNGTMAITDGTRQSNNFQGDAQRISMNIAIDPAREYSNADLFGDYYMIGYEYDSWWSDYISFSGILSADGNGAYPDISELTVNWYNTIDTGGDVGGTYAVNPDGSFSLDGGGTGFISADGAIAAFTNPDDPEVFNSYFLMKRGDRPYSTPDLAGTWALAGFGDEDGGPFTADFGTMTCDTDGNCWMSMRNQTGNATGFWSGSAAPDNSSLEVATDGSFGGSAVPGSPYYAGAIGNDGHTIILNTSFGPDPTQRHIFIGVRKDNAVNLAGFPYGDVNGDGLVGMADAIKALQVLVNLNSGPFNSLADVDGDQRIGLAETIYIMQNLAGHRGRIDEPKEPEIYTANGTYSYTPGSPGTFTMNTTFSDFACEGPSTDTAEQHTVIAMSADTMIWEDSEGYQDTWTRDNGTIGDPVGFWTMDDYPNAYELTINGDNTFSLTGYIVDCGDYGNSESTEEYSVWAGISRNMSAAATDDTTVLHFHIWAPQYEVTQVVVDGPGLDSPWTFYPCSLETRNNVVVDDFCVPELQGNTGGYPIGFTPQVDDTYSFTVTRSGVGQDTFYQTITNVILEAPQVTSPSGHSLADANLDGTLIATWTVPTEVLANEIVLLGQACTAGHASCVSVEGTVDNLTSGTISLPGDIDMVPVAIANIDVRVHHGADAFTNCFYEFE